MQSSLEPLKDLEVGPFGELSVKPNPNGLVVLTIPDFDQMLPFLVEQAGGALTSEEIEKRRQQAPSMALTPEVARKLTEARNSR